METKVNQDLREFLNFHFEMLEKNVDKISHKMERVENAVFVSNGKPSILARLDSLEKQAAEAEEKVTRGRGERIALWTSVGIAILTVVAPKLLQGLAWVAKSVATP